MTQYILVVVGNFPDGFMLYGPFAGREEANECARQFSQRTCVEQLFDPPVRTQEGDLALCAVARTEIRQLAEDPDIAFTIKAIDAFFCELPTKSLGVCPELAGKTAEEVIENYWRLLKDGALRLYDPEVDDDVVIVAEAETPGQRARARHVGAKLWAIRQHLRRGA
jgi:hypothetical protein